MAQSNCNAGEDIGQVQYHFENGWNESSAAHQESAEMVGRRRLVSSISEAGNRPAKSSFLIDGTASDE